MGGGRSSLCTDLMVPKFNFKNVGTLSMFTFFTKKYGEIKSNIHFWFVIYKLTIMILQYQQGLRDYAVWC